MLPAFLCLFFGVVIGAALIQRRVGGQSAIRLSSQKFWTLVKSQPQPIVMVVRRGLWGTKMSYAFPYNGVVFRTDVSRPEAPVGVLLVDAGSSFTV